MKKITIKYLSENKLHKFEKKINNNYSERADVIRKSLLEIMNIDPEAIVKCIVFPDHKTKFGFLGRFL